MKGVIDRFEGGVAVVEFDGSNRKNINLTDLPTGIKEGNVIIFDDGKWQLDQNQTARLKAEIDILAGDVFE
jgi:pyruvate kinase